MELRGACVVLGLLLLLNVSVQQKPPKRKPLKKAETKDKAIEALQKQINTIVQEMKLVKQQQALQTVCLKGIKVLNKCFLVDSAKKSYHAASEDCNSKGGVLAVPVSSSENTQLLDYIQQSLGCEEEVWLGINDMITEGDWVDQTGMKITYKNWAPIVLTGPGLPMAVGHRGAWGARGQPMGMRGPMEPSGPMRCRGLMGPMGPSGPRGPMGPMEPRRLPGHSQGAYDWPVQPDGGTSQNCAVMSTGVSGEWFDENCKEEKASVCQFNIV